MLLPEARRYHLVVQDVGDEVIVFDQERHLAHSLNRTLALVWRHCDGQTSVPTLAALVAREIGLPADEEVVWAALERLERAQLLVAPVARLTPTSVVTRRDFVRNVALA